MQNLLTIIFLTLFIESRKILIYPNGFYNEAPKAISVFLDSVDCVAPDYKIFVDFKLRIRDHINNEHAEERG